MDYTNLTQEQENHIKRLIAYANTLRAFVNIKHLCPKCKEYMIIEGYVCLGCGWQKGDDI